MPGARAASIVSGGWRRCHVVAHWAPRRITL